MARYLYGLEFPPNDLRLGLLEAKKGKSISTVEQIILYCYHYDPQGGKYVLIANRVMQVGAGGIALVLFGILGSLWVREIKRAKKKKDVVSDRPAEEAAAV
jgi:protein SCO1/2